MECYTHSIWRLGALAGSFRPRRRSALPSSCHRRAAGDRSARPYVYFGDEGDIYAVNAVSGIEVWHRHPDDQSKALLSGAPVLYKDKLYVPVSSVEEMGSSLKVSVLHL